jgi:hypothetical protein
MTTLTATEPIIRARLSRARAKRYRTGVLGLRAKPAWDGTAFEHDGTPVTVVACPSVLSIWEAIEARDPDQWTVVLTNVEDDELGDTVLAHLLDGRLITPDPWDALRSNFCASTIEPALYRCADDRAVANGLLAALSPDSYTPAPGGVLTQEHAMSTLARDVLKIVKDSAVEVDALAVLEWSRSPRAAESLIELRSAGGAELAAAFQAWLVERCGRLARPLTALLDTDRVAELVPLGVVAGLFNEGGDTAVALGVFLGRYGLSGLSTEDLTAWSNSASGLLTRSLSTNQQLRVLAEATAIVNELEIANAAASSALLPHGLDARLDSLADSLTAALPTPLPVDLTAPLIARDALSVIERRWNPVEGHFLAAGSPTYRAFKGALRLVRWLAEPMPLVTGLAAAVDDYLRNTSWVDTALVTARRGAEKPIPAAALRAVIEAASVRRAVGDRTFAAALAGSPNPSVLTVENLLPDKVIPLAKTVPTLLVVVDGLSVAAANDLVTALQRDGWIEVSASGDPLRGAALAVLPTLTQRSRCSLLCGELREGTDDAERAGFVSLIRQSQLQPTGGVPDPIFHKKALDAVPSGLSLATDVNNAIADVSNQRLVAVVLNYVDDTLHHTDPGGTDWNLDTITHLRPLLHAARNAGRTVVITSDHGHLIEYGTSAKVDRANTYGQRAHGDFAHVDPDREVVVEGPRVLTQSNRVVLGVDENIRYGARNAGYHGGGAPAEAVVAVVVLAAGQLPANVVAVTSAEPPWWHPGVLPAEPETPGTPPRKKKAQQEPTLFDDNIDAQGTGLAEQVVATAVFAQQVKLAGRIVVRSDQIRNLLHVLLTAGAHEITVAQAAAALRVAEASVNGALMQTKRVLDVEGYEVLRVERGVVRLDVAALTEQFGVTS